MEREDMITRGRDEMKAAVGVVRAVAGGIIKHGEDQESPHDNVGDLAKIFINRAARRVLPKVFPRFFH